MLSDFPLAFNLQTHLAVTICLLLHGFLTVRIVGNMKLALLSQYMLAVTWANWQQIKLRPLAIARTSLIYAFPTILRVRKLM